jgi:hypothetical protein
MYDIYATYISAVPTGLMKLKDVFRGNPKRFFMKIKCRIKGNNGV